MANNPKEQNNLKLNINPEVAAGTYSNLVVVSHCPIAAPSPSSATR